jgi:hypothetical protein
MDKLAARPDRCRSHWKDSPTAPDKGKRSKGTRKPRTVPRAVAPPLADAGAAVVSRLERETARGASAARWRPDHEAQ